MSRDTVGSLLADIANAISEGLRVLAFADKSQWGPDEHEQRRRLAEALDEAKKDFQELSPLVHGQRYYMNDRKPESLSELRVLRANFLDHADNFREWARHGGPINPTWAIETTSLRNELHRAQCRAARRIFAAERDSPAPRCLGAFLVYRKQRLWAERAARRKQEQAEAFARAQEVQEGGGRAGQEGGVDGDNGENGGVEAHGASGDDSANGSGNRERQSRSKPGSRRSSWSPSLPPTPTQPHRHKRQGSSLVPMDDAAADDVADDEYEMQRQHLEELALCNAIGKFERFGDRDIVFVCDFCDGHVVWEDLESMPSIRTVDEETLAAAATEEVTSPTSATATAPPSGGLSADAATGQPNPSPSSLGTTTITATATATPRVVRPAAPEAPGVIQWQATGFSLTRHEEKSVVFAPLAIANHVAPGRGDWMARLRCAGCDEPPADWEPPEGEEDDGAGSDWPVDDELVFDDLEALREHLEWQHTASTLPAAAATTSCAVM